jgi:alginate O-acetyltransferase complex protein AlgI
MIFNSIEFLLFLPTVFVLYWLLRSFKVEFQNSLVLVASYVFYGWWDWRFLSLIAFSTVVDYFLGLKIHEARSPQKRKAFLIASLLINLGILGFFKYYNFFVSSFTEGLQNLGIQIDTWTLNIILPVGISFYTFQTLSYSIDIYRGKIRPTKDFIAFAAFVSFFPQLVAGPIERASHLLPQFLKTRRFSFKQARLGITLMVYGMFKKVVVADRLAVYVNSVFDELGNASSISLCIATVFFAFQIYCDFSGYSLIARGAAKLFGFELMVNFRRPYLAANIADFWRRWHISLSTWFRDYVYIPLGGNKVKTERYLFNLFVVFLVSGLWHGANWTFVVWGALHGVFQIVYSLFSMRNKSQTAESWTRTIKVINVIFVFTLVCFAWIFFRAENVQQAFYTIHKILQFDLSLNLVQITAGLGPLNLALSVFAVLLLFASYLLPEQLNFKKSYQHIIFSSVAILLIISMGVNEKTDFIYFQF